MQNTDCLRTFRHIEKLKAANKSVWNNRSASSKLKDKNNLYTMRNIGLTMILSRFCSLKIIHVIDCF